MTWNLKDKNGKYRSRNGFKRDLKERSLEPWERLVRTDVYKTKKHEFGYTVEKGKHFTYFPNVTSRKQAILMFNTNWRK